MIRSSTLLSPAVVVSAALALAACAGSANAEDFIITVSGTYQSFFNDGFNFDGTNTTPLAPLYDIPRLTGGTISASYRFSAVTNPPAGSFTSYDFAAPAGMTYELFDAMGALVHSGTSPSDAFAFVFNNSASPSGMEDGVSLFSFVNTVTGLTAPAPLYSPSGELGALQSAMLFSGSVTPGTNYLTDLSLPLDAATYLSFPNSRVRVGAFFGDGDFLDQADPFQYVETSVSYSITSVSISQIPTPGAASVLALGGLVARRRRRR